MQKQTKNRKRGRQGGGGRLRFGVLERERVIRTERGWRVRFRGPQARRWREGVQALFVAVVPQRFLAADSTPVETAFHSLA